MYKMWMVDHNKEMNIPTKFRPLMPRPYSSISNPSCSCIRNPNILQWSHPISGLSDYGVRREVPLVSTRWNPTPEQLQALEEMYRRGIRTPSAEQIQQIAAKLRRFGKIEGKNVFYWFQNHKARERQKKRRQLDLQLTANKIQRPHDNHHHTNQTPGLSRRYIEIEHHKKLPTPIKCSSTEDKKLNWKEKSKLYDGKRMNLKSCNLYFLLGLLLYEKDSASMQAAVISADNNNNIGWSCTTTQLHHKILTAENEQLVHLSPNNSSLNALTAHNPTVPQYASLAMQLPNFEEGIDHEAKENRATTLQLFPIRESGGSFTRKENGILREKFGPSEFIEFLPTKN